MASKIRELKETIVEQNEALVTLRADRQAMRDVLASLYGGLVKYKIPFQSNTTSAETSSYPEVRGEDISRLSHHELVKSVGECFRVVTTSLEETRAELHGIYKEIDSEVEDALAQWHSIRAQESNQRKGQAFRNDTVLAHPQTRAKTPEVPVANGVTRHDSPVVAQITSNTPDKNNKRENTVNKTKTPTTTIEKLLSPKGTGPAKPTTNGTSK